MSIDPVYRLMALHLEDARDAEEIHFWPTPASSEAVSPETIAEALESAVSAFIDLLEDGICRGVDEVQLDLHVGELIALALRGRTRRHGRPFMTTRQQVLREATITFAENRTEALRRQGFKVGEARRLAAEESSTRAYKSGDRVAASTIVKLMKERATRAKAPKSPD